MSILRFVRWGSTFASDPDAAAGGGNRRFALVDGRPDGERYRVVAIDMGYGHLRPAHALAQVLGTAVHDADRPPLASPREQRQWSYGRKYYELVSRGSRWPFVGAPLRGLLDSLTDIRDPVIGARDTLKRLSSDPGPELVREWQ